MSLPLKNVVLPLKNLVKIKTSDKVGGGGVGAASTLRALVWANNKGEGGVRAPQVSPLDPPLY